MAVQIAFLICFLARKCRRNRRHPLPEEEEAATCTTEREVETAGTVARGAATVQPSRLLGGTLKTQHIRELKSFFKNRSTNLMTTEGWMEKENEKIRKLEVEVLQLGRLHPAVQKHEKEEEEEKERQKNEAKVETRSVKRNRNLFRLELSRFQKQLLRKRAEEKTDDMQDLPPLPPSPLSDQDYEYSEAHFYDQPPFEDSNVEPPPDSDFDDEPVDEANYNDPSDINVYEEPQGAEDHHVYNEPIRPVPRELGARPKNLAVWHKTGRYFQTNV